ncbi:hypothetical protein [Dactylosporangium sp. CS-033363]|uniref:hypothetical protein n=1 Tax=Dactylosporangium sp. CS-033363 TaxID=3239935 RepID=UPI003D8ED343
MTAGPGAPPYDDDSGMAQLGLALVGEVVDLGGNLRRERVSAELDGGAWEVWVYKMRRGGIPTLHPARFAVIAVPAAEVDTLDGEALAAYDRSMRAIVLLELEFYDLQHGLQESA